MVLLPAPFSPSNPMIPSGDRDVHLVQRDGRAVPFRHLVSAS